LQDQSVGRKIPQGLKEQGFSSARISQARDLPTGLKKQLLCQNRGSSKGELALVIAPEIKVQYFHGILMYFLCCLIYLLPKEKEWKLVTSKLLCHRNFVILNIFL